MDKKPSNMVTTLLIALTVLAIAATVLLDQVYKLSPGHTADLYFASLVLPAIVVALGTARSVWHRRFLLTSGVTTAACVILLLTVVVELTNL